MKNILVIGRPSTGKSTYVKWRLTKDQNPQLRVCEHRSFLESPSWVRWDQYVVFGPNINDTLLYGSSLSEQAKSRIIQMGSLIDRPYMYVSYYFDENSGVMLGYPVRPITTDDHFDKPAPVKVTQTDLFSQTSTAETVTMDRNFSQVVTMKRVPEDAEPRPYIRATEETADKTAKLCAHEYASKCIRETHKEASLRIVWEEEKAPEVNRKVADNKILLTFDVVRRCASVSHYTREADGIVYSGKEKTVLLAEFVAHAVNSIVSPLKVNQWFEAREKAAAEVKALAAAEAAAKAAPAVVAAAVEVKATVAAVVAEAAKPAPAPFTMDAFSQ